MKKYIFWIALSLLGAAWIVNIVIYHKAKLEEPIVLKHYIELPKEQGHEFSIYYLTNKNNPAFLHSMILEGLVLPNITPSYDLFLSGNKNSISNSPAFVQEFNHYLLLKAQFDPSMVVSQEAGTEAFAWDHILLSFSDGTTKEFDLGEIKLYPFITQNNKLKSDFSGSSSDGLHSYIYSAEEQLQLKKIRIPSRIEQDVNVKIHYKDQHWEAAKADLHSGNVPDWDSKKKDVANELAWPIQMEANEKVSLNIQIDPMSSNAIDAWVAWEGETTDGGTVSVPIMIHHIPHLTDQALKDLLLKEREAK